MIEWMEGGWLDGVRLEGGWVDGSWLEKPEERWLEEGWLKRGLGEAERAGMMAGWEAGAVLKSREGTLRRLLVARLGGSRTFLEWGGGGGRGEGMERVPPLTGILHCPASSLVMMPASSSTNIFILAKGSRPFCVSTNQGLGLASKSLTEPCDSPNTFSPNTL